MWMATAIIVAAAAAAAALLGNDCVMKGEIIYFYCSESFQFTDLAYVRSLSGLCCFDYRNVASQRQMKANIFRIVLSESHMKNVYSISISWCINVDILCATNNTTKAYLTNEWQFLFWYCRQKRSEFSNIEIENEPNEREKKHISSSIRKIRLLRIKTNTLQCFCAEKKNARTNEKSKKNKWKIFNFPLATRIPRTDDRQRSMRLNFSRKKIKLPIWFLSFVRLNFFFGFCPSIIVVIHTCEAATERRRRRAHAVASDPELCSVFNWFKLPWVIWEREWGWKWTRKRERERERIEREMHRREKKRNENFMKCEYSGNNNGRSISISSIKHTNTQFGMVSIRCAHLKHSIMYFHMSGVSLSVRIGAFFFIWLHA